MLIYGIFVKTVYIYKLVAVVFMWKIKSNQHKITGSAMQQAHIKLLRGSR